MADGLDAFDQLETILRHSLSIYNECADHCVSFAINQENSPKTKVTTFFNDFFVRVSLN